MNTQELANNYSLTDIAYIFRYNIRGTFSIESVFEPIASCIPNSKCVYVPFIGNGLVNIIRNIWYARAHQGSINHITGDIHYVMLGLSSRRTNILTIHDCGILLDKDKPAWKQKLLKYLWFKWPVQLADIVTTVSEKTKMELMEILNCPESKIVVIPNYVNPSFKYIHKEFNYKKPKILFVGSTPNKNLSRVIEALSGINCELRIIGFISEENLNRLENCRLEFSHNASIPYVELVKEYEESDIVLFVSTYEGFGLPILEAQATGRVLITSEIEPCKEIAGNGSICVDPFNILAIREAILRVIQDEQLRYDVIESGLLNVRRYSKASIVAEYRQLYKQHLKYNG